MESMVLETIKWLMTIMIPLLLVVGGLCLHGSAKVYEDMDAYKGTPTMFRIIGILMALSSIGAFMALLKFSLEGSP